MTVISLIFWVIVIPCIIGILINVCRNEDKMTNDSVVHANEDSIEDMDLVGVQVPYVTDYDKLLEPTRTSHFYDNQ